MRYIVSEDISLLLKTWAEQNGYALPLSLITFLRQKMKMELKRIFGDVVEIVDENLLQQGLKSLCQQTDLPIVSLDRSYVRHQWQLNINRTVDTKLNDLGEKERFGHVALTDQIADLKKSDLRQIALLDDVVFSGNGIIRLIDQLNQEGIEVKSVIAGIVIGEGNDRIAKREIPIWAVRHYAEVIDEVCERDFYPGVPFSGRSVHGQLHNVGAPYIHPFGKPAEWASIPENQTESFSKFCLAQAITLWQGIEKVSGRPVYCQDIDRLPIGAPKGSGCFSEYLLSLL